MDTYTKRLLSIAQAKALNVAALTRDSKAVRQHSVLTDTELDWALIAARQQTKKRGVGTRPHHLDINSISALRGSEGLSDERACLNPKWIGLQCTHRNTTARIARCRWCDGCMNAWRGRVRAMISEGANAEHTFFWTLTLKEYPEEMDEERFDFIQTRWRRLLRVFNKNDFQMEYFRVIELQKRGTPHYHVAVNRISQLQKWGLDKTRRFMYNAGVRSGFGVQWDFQRAEWGAAGVASYMAKYLGKGNDYRALLRSDGRAVRRYSRSGGWIDPPPENAWRYAAVAGAFKAEALPETDVPCRCGLHESQTREEQAQRWLSTNRRVGSWVAPLGVLDYILEKEAIEKS